MTFHFDLQTALVPLAEGNFRGRVSEDYWVQSGPNGGYLSAIALRGASALVPEAGRIARSLHVRFLASPKAGELELHAETLRKGRSMTTVAVRMRQEGRDFLHASACFSEPFSAIAFQDRRMPEALPLAQATPIDKRIPMNHRFDMLRAIGPHERTGERALSGGYLRFSDLRPIDVFALAALWDCWPPAVFARAMERRFRGAVPTVEASVYFRRRTPLSQSKPEDYVLIKVEATMADEGVVEESSEIWSSDGLLLAQSLQLALLM